ncbi:MAG TPA: VOC family protein [Pseudomonadales bacterium]
MPNYKGIVPYLFYDDAEAAMQWYARVFGFEEIGRWTNADGKIQNAEMRVGDTELWLDGGGARPNTDQRLTWIGVWVGDVDAMYTKVQSAGVSCNPPADRPFGVRILDVPDGMGHRWGFMRRIAPKTA